ncbi:MAG: phosphatidate cytidylyltransferase, partial [Oscillospiraceae bacterium]
MAVFAFCFASIVVFNFEKIEFKTVASNVAFGIYVLVGFYSICRLQIVLPYEKFGWDGAFLFVFSAVIAWGGDISAYFSGVLFGKHKLAPVLSPKKTVEGAIGGVIGSVVFTWLFLWAYSLIKPIAEGTNIVYEMDLKIIAIVGLVAFAGSIVGMIGDLFASAIKRQTGIKDYGNIMPGHGGIIDRFDSVFLVAPLISSMAGFIAAAGGIFYV